jgi:hypothetical protein
MNMKDDDEDDVKREERIAELKREAQELAGGEMAAGGMEDTPPEVEEGFWKHVVDYEKAPWTTNFKQLEEAGIELPAPETLNDEQITKKLWEVIHGLALLRVFLDDTDHLSDRELYTALWSDLLREEVKALPPDPDGAWHLSPIGSGSEDDTYLQMKYYADEKWREMWMKDVPDYVMPEHEDPPYDRDRLLPQPDYGPQGETDSVN